MLNSIAIMLAAFMLFYNLFLTMESGLVIEHYEAFYASDSILSLGV